MNVILRKQRGSGRRIGNSEFFFNGSQQIQFLCIGEMTQWKGKMDVACEKANSWMIWTDA